jgi:hypothetical protein
MKPETLAGLVIVGGALALILVPFIWSMVDSYRKRRNK